MHDQKQKRTPFSHALSQPVCVPGPKRQEGRTPQRCWTARTVAPDPKAKYFTLPFSCRHAEKKVSQNAEHRCDAMNRENHSNAREKMRRY
jgi:hypothetical protein